MCAACEASLAGAPTRRVGRVLVSSAYRHDGAARVLVHRLKYGGLPAVAKWFAEAMVPLLPATAAALVPVPRAVVRRWRYGVDPAAELVHALGRLVGVPVVEALRPATWWRRRAGPAERHRGAPVFRQAAVAPAGSVLVDDVVTTGATLVAASGALGGLHHALTATAAGR